MFMIMTVSSPHAGSVMGDSLPTKHPLMPKQLGGKISGISPKIPLIQPTMKGRTPRRMMLALRHFR